MIASLRGRVEQVTENAVVVEVGGVGLMVAVPAPLAARLQPGQPVALFTRLIVREDALALFGFESPDQRSFFELLLTVSGVGPKVALSLLSHFSLETLHQAVGANQPERLAGIPGVGRKTAEKIVFHLSQGDVWKLADHPDQENYPGQRIYFVVVDEYVYLVPYIVEGDHIFLKTIIPSRKATKKYLLKL